LTNLLSRVLERPCPDSSFDQTIENQSDRRPHDHLHAERCDAKFPEQRGRKSLEDVIDRRRAGLNYRTIVIITANTTAATIDALDTPKLPIKKQRSFNEKIVTAIGIATIR
jgi:hypothetical protein